MSETVVIAAGGTGGHISPGIGLAEILSTQKEKFGIAKVFIHSLERNRSNPDLQEAPCEILWHNTPPITKKLLIWPFSFLLNVLRTFLKFNRLSIDVVIVMGGYSSLPAVLYARLFSKKLYLCEQNCVIGKLNRYFLKKATAISFAFPPVNFKSPSIRNAILGNPLRNKIFPNSSGVKEYTFAKKEKLNVLVMGGSQGARQINHIILDSMGHPELSKTCVFRILTGNNLYEDTLQKLKSSTPKENIIPYANDMKLHYEWADLVIARSGAGVVSECMAYRLPMILIPYPYAADNHQLANAEYCKEKGAAYIIEQKDEDNSRLLEIILDLGENREKLSAMSEAAWQIANLNAAEDTASFFFGRSDA
ncbi:MAG: UDP-N-acetylglucosamine--N-acetylmuramyl-(pentapeptide) pyrophosphoryl-undecaprenol N-acetylglucosamine transferase [Spirochaetota bacterium]